MDRTVLIDGNNLTHRSHAIFVDNRKQDPFHSHSGYPTGLIYGCLSMLSDWLPSISNPNRGLFFLDGSPKRRRAIDPNYKQKDPSSGPTPGISKCPITLLDGFQAANELDIIIHVLGLFGIDTLQDPDEEADDLIASYTKQHPGDIHVVISSDKDFYQIITDTVILYRPGVEGSRFFDAERAEEHMLKRYKVRVGPKGVRIFKSLTGDPSDGIVGVPFLRKKVAAPLCELPDIDAVYASGLPGFSDLEKQRMQDLRERVQINYLLTGLHYDLDLESCRRTIQPDPQMAMKILREDLQIHGVDPHSFRFASTGRVRYSEPIAASVPALGIMPDGLFDDL